MSKSVVIVSTGTANTASVVAAFRRAGATPKLADDAKDVEAGDRVVVPGVGSFGAAMSRIDQVGMREVLSERIDEGRPTLAICLGLHLLCSASEESPGQLGLDLVPETVTRFDDEVRVPQLGWNMVEPERGSRFLTRGWAYFANSYRLSRIPQGWTGATSDYGGRFVSALERDDVLACQFHPELSGAWGAGILERWLTVTSGVA